MSTSRSPSLQGRPLSPPLTGSTQPPAPIGASSLEILQSRYGFIKSRKSSCELCHRRKIRCDQTRPQCAACLHRAVDCVYLAPNDPSWQQQDGVEAVAATRATWVTATATAPMPAKKKQAIRERILSGFEDSSDDEVVVTGGKPMQIVKTESIETPVRAVEAEGEEEKSASEPPSDVPEDLDALFDELSQSSRKGSVPLSGTQEAPRTAAVNGKRGREEHPAEDELSGELLELASAPKPKKKTRPSSTKQHDAYAELSLSGGRARPSLSATFPPQASPSSSKRDSRRSHHPPTPVSASESSPYTISLMSLLSTLPSSDMQTILFNTFFADPFLPSGITLLRPQYLEDFRLMLKRRNHGKLRDGDATTLANAFVFLAVALRILPEETSRLLLSAVPLPPSSGWPVSSIAHGPVYPRSLSRILAALPPIANDTTPLHQRYFDLALIASQVAEQHDPPSVMLVMLKLVKYRYAMLSRRSDSLVPAAGWLAQGIKVAQALGMGKEWEGIPQGERELRRRVMWALYVADRQHSYLTCFPYTINDQHNLIALPSPMSEQDLYGVPPDAPALPPHTHEASPTPCTALFIKAHLSRIVTPMLDTFVTMGRAGTPHDLVLRFDASLSAFQEALPPYLAFPPHTYTLFDLQHSYLPAHRIQLHAQLLEYRLALHRAHLAHYLEPATPAAARKLIAQLCIATLRVHRSARILDPKVAPRLFRPDCVFEAAATMGLVMHVEKIMGEAHALSDDWIGMRAGIVEAMELLDGVTVCFETASFAIKSAAVLRDVKGRLDKWETNRPQARAESAPKSSTAKTPARAASAPAAEHSSPESSRRLAPAPSQSRSPDRSPAETPKSEERILGWLSSLRRQNIEILMRDASVKSWESVIAGM